jgi:sugar/nucleoside kinase (ribokinase family)
LGSLDVSVVGELNLDLIFYGLPEEFESEREHLANDFRMTLGSSSAIFAHNLALLGNRVGFSSCVGGDALGEIGLKRLDEGGVDTSRTRKLSNKTTGVTTVLLSAKHRYIFTYPGTIYDLQYSDLDLDYVCGAKHFHLSSYFLHRSLRAHIGDLFHQTKQAKLTTSLDTNDDPEGRWDDDLQKVLKHVDVFLPNEREACMIARVDNVQKAAEVLSEIVPIVVVKRGSQGALVRRGRECFTAPPPVVQSVDFVGAGDSFNAGFLHKFIRGATLQDCLVYGNIAGALSTTCAGGTEAFRDRSHREQFFRDIGSPGV